MKLTPELLKKIIAEEAAKFGKMSSTEDAADDADETDADEYADSLGKHIDFVKALKIEEARLTQIQTRVSKRIKQIREAREQHAKKILAKI